MPRSGTIFLEIFLSASSGIRVDIPCGFVAFLRPCLCLCRAGLIPALQVCCILYTDRVVWLFHYISHSVRRAAFLGTFLWVWAVV